MQASRVPATLEHADALDVPAEAGHEVLGRFPAPRTGPVALAGYRMRFFVAPGSAEELPGLLDWLEWSGIPLDLVPLCGREAAYDDGAQAWLRPPVPDGGRHAGAPFSLPAMTLGTQPNPAADGRSGGTVGLTALVSALATACHRVRLRVARTDQPCAFSYASRICAGTRPRSLTS
ncbi:hypothetical protein OG937_20850 [Streptomyces sp. NBC_00510]|nr:hypothetical protein [Streptomyces sp. PA03-1a]MDX2703763.1 hypothetical protein [Streptomyces sp. PA03-6a]MDX2817835.1 hypothetical protein [Streptomyces sp. PA03-5A]